MQTSASALEHHYVYVNDIRMHYVKAGHGERLVLLLHGFPEFWYSWRHQIGPLSQRFTVVAPDLRGYNLTDKPSWGYETDVLVQDVVSLIKKLGHEQAIVAGHDWGGAIAWGAAIAFPQRVERLIALNCPHPGAFLRALQANPSQALRSWYMGFFQLPLLPELAIRANDYAFVEQALRGTAVNKSAFSDEDIDAYKTALAQPGALTAALNYYRAAFMRGPNGFFSGVGEQVQAPTLMIWGEQDIALSKEITYDTGKYVPNLRIEYLPDCSHWVQQDCPQRVSELMLEFLADLG